MAPPNDALFLGLDDFGHLLRVAVRLGVALLLGGILGWEREKEHKAAGPRTHWLVSLGSALFILVGVEVGMKLDNLSRVIQGLVVGIGFLGGGTILKLDEQQQVRGLTTAANIWLTAAVGLAVGLGLLWPAILGVALGWVVLAFVAKLEGHLRGSPKSPLIQGSDRPLPPAQP
jgi:putative Mg2+ transporter-C (MgtC) family protein